jgi:pimeloyl-ACP methyl ester carboxylesterase
MKKLLYLILLVLLPCSLFAQDITGNWNGLLALPNGSMRIGITITKNGTGYTATTSSPDQGVKDFPVKSISFENNTLLFSIPQVQADYKGIYQSNSFKGTFTQGGYSLPLDFGRDEVKLAKPVRPQEPVQPYPYYSEEVTFKNAKANINLAGTLTLPKKEGNYPAVLLITGSGPQNRDSELLDHKSFLVLSDYLTRNGIAVLRVDDRGVGSSAGNFETATSEDFATDVEAAFNYLKTRKDINKKKIGLVGHSEGGMIAPMVAANNPDVAFIVLLAGPGVTGDEVMKLQNYMIGKANGMPEEELTKLAGINMQVYNAVKQPGTPEQMNERVTAVFNKEMKPLFISKGIPQEEITKYIKMQVDEITSPWFVYFLRHNPAPALEKVKCPVLALNGEKDLQVAPVANLDGIKRALEKGGNKKVTIKQLPGLNHLFQESATGSPTEYSTIEQTFSPVALNEITTWITKQVK